MTRPLNNEPAPQTRGDCFARGCTARLVLSHLSSRWSSLIVAALMGEEVLRFSELRVRIDGISEKVLSEKLKELERDGLLARKMYPVVPPRVEYRLTPMGKGAAEHVRALVEWIEANIGDFENAQQNYDAVEKPRFTESPLDL